MRGSAPARKPPGAAPAPRETHFATRSAFPFVSFQPCQRRWKRLRVKSPGPVPTRKPKELARRVAEAQIDLRCVRYAGHQFLSDTLSKQYYDSLANIRMKEKVLDAILRRNPLDISMETLKFMTSTPQGPDKLATVLSGEAKKLLAMDRYERRALSGRKFAIRAFDAANRDRAG